ncbi:MAG: ATP-binding protein [Chloroflexota bacterium]|nr:ATP-binding protein [Chloroflexota bacterium]
MSIRRKVLLTIPISIALVTISLYLLAHLLLMPRFQALEYDFIAADVARVRYELLDELDDMTTVLAANAFWDQTYAFVSGNAPDYTETILDPFFLTTLDMDLIVYRDRTDTFRHAQYVNEQGASEPVPNELLNLLKPYSSTIQMQDRTDIRKGLVSFEEVVLLVVVLPILPSDMSGEAAGTVLAAQYLNRQELDELRTNLQLSVDFLAYQPLETALRYTVAHRTLSDGTVVHIGTHDSTSAQRGMVTMLDPLDNPTVTIIVNHDSAIIEQGYSTILYLGISFLVITSLLALVLIMVINHQLLSRLKRLRARVSAVERCDPSSQPLRLSGSDELAEYSHALEDLLEVLARSNQDVAQARDEAVKALAVKTHILANVSHDARTPLTVILLRAEMLLTERFGTLNERQREMIIGVQASGKQMLFFINNLLATAKLATDNFWLHEKPFEIRGFVQEVEHFVKPLCQMHGTTLNITCAPDMPAQIVGDREYLKQITCNLLDNAIKSAAAGKVSLTVDKVDETQWCIRIKDSGKGIPEAELSRIFDSLYQDADPARRSSNSGSGLGLAVVKQLTELMHGRVSVTSYADIGTTFVVTLPLKAIA